MPEHHKINYIEFPATDIEGSKAFFHKVFGWEFQDFGPDYTSFNGQGTDGGFFSSELKVDASGGSALIVLYSANLKETEQAVREAGGLIVREIFSFPGGRRFHFTDPSGNEFAVWSE